MKTFDLIFWFAVWTAGLVGWAAIEWFNWLPEPREIAIVAFLALAFAAGARVRLYDKVDRQK